MNEVNYRATGEADLPLLLSLIRELAADEDFPDAVTVEIDDLESSLFGAHPAAEAWIIEVDDKAAGYVIFYHSFSSTTGKRGLHLEDLYLRPAYRGLGIGKQTLARLAQLALERGCGRFEWWVLDWNHKASDFYETMGARKMHELRIFRLAGEQISRLAAPTES